MLFRSATAPVPLGVAMNNPPPQLQPIVDIDAKIDWYASYSVITKQVTLINQDPQTLNYGIYKSSLIVLKLLAGNAEDNKVQAAERWAA